VYEDVLAGDPKNERARARLIEIRALVRHLSGGDAVGARALPDPPDSRAVRRQAIERTISRLEGFLAAVKKG
jgi:hypothetical protein